MKKLDQATLFRLKQERSHMQLALDDFSIFYDSCSEKRTRRQIRKTLDILKARILEFDRVVSILRLKEEI